MPCRLGAQPYHRVYLLGTPPVPSLMGHLPMGLSSISTGVRREVIVCRLPGWDSYRLA